MRLLHQEEEEEWILGRIIGIPQEVHAELLGTYNFYKTVGIPANTPGQIYWRLPRKVFGKTLRKSWEKALIRSLEKFWEHYLKKYYEDSQKQYLHVIVKRCYGLSGGMYVQFWKQLLSDVQFWKQLLSGYPEGFHIKVLEKFLVESLKQFRTSYQVEFLTEVLECLFRISRRCLFFSKKNYIFRYKKHNSPNKKKKT